MIEACSEAGIDVGVELPCELDKESRLFSLLDELHASPVKFLNLNELEITVGNQEKYGCSRLQFERWYHCSS